MPKTRPPYALEFRQQTVDLVRAGHNPEDLARRARDQRDLRSTMTGRGTVRWGVAAGRAVNVLA